MLILYHLTCLLMRHALRRQGLLKTTLEVVGGKQLSSSSRKEKHLLRAPLFPC